MSILTIEQESAIIAAINSAGEVLVRLRPLGAENKLNVTKKSDGTVVTEADLLSNQLLVTAITKLFPNDAILSEESPFTEEELRVAKRVWVIDPLDGTKSFVRGDDDFSILVALCVNNAPVFGAMLFPAQEKLVVASQGKPALCNQVPIKVSNSATLRPKRVYIRNFECTAPNMAAPMMDSGAALFKVASGGLDGAIIRMTTHREWDIAAPAAVITSAGGELFDETMSPIKFGTGRIDFKYLIASNSRVNRDLRALIPD